MQGFNRVMSIDYGSKRIGIALSDPLLTFASPFTTLKNDDQLIKNLEKIVVEKEVNKIILGYPDNYEREESKLAEKVRSFKDTLTSLFRVEVILWDENFTSSIASQKILESVNKKKKRRDKGLIDSMAASVILQEYLSSMESRVK